MSEPARSAEQIISDIENMKVKGAYLITVVGLEALTLRAKEATAGGKPIVVALTADAQRLKAAQPSMASVANGCDYVLQPLLNLQRPITLDETVHLVSTRSQEFLARFGQAQQAVEEIGARLVREGDTIFVHSYSGTLLGIFRRAWEAGRRFRVQATESRPGCEGRVLVGELLKLGIPCTLTTDIALASYIRKASKAIVGADSILADGSVVNKMGTHLLALACQAHGVPLYAAGGTHKLSLESVRGGEVRLLERPAAEGGIAPAELLDHPNLRVENTFFDVTPARYFTGLITERGIVPPAAVATFLDDPLLSQIR